jgi:RHS repeat-associated protein
MLVPNRHDSLEDYRYGFQGQEKDDEIKGEGNSLNYTFRMHDPRLGRFFAVDPLTKKYPWYSPYQFSGNRVMQYVELEGLEEAGSLELYTRRREIARETGKISDGEYHNQTLAAGAAGAAGGLVAVSAFFAPEVAAAYGTYCTWFSGTTFSAYLSTGTGATLFAYLENAYTLRGLVQTNVGVGAFSATANLGGQMTYNGGKIDENINWAQPLFAGLIKNPFYSNFLESFVNIRDGEKISMNIFDKNFFSTFASNLIGSKIGSKVEVQDIGYKPAENVLNVLSGTLVETAENKIETEMLKIEIPKVKSEVKTKKKQSGIFLDGGINPICFPPK